MRRRTVERITGDAKTGADILLAQQRVGRYPAAKLARQLARMLHIGFGHQHDKLVSSVAGYHIGAPAISLQNLSHALQNEVAFKVPVEIVHKFEAVEVHEYECKGAASPGRTLPFRGQRFHEKPMCLDTGEPIGDGLLLCFLEGKRVVQRAGDQVGQRAQKENFLLGEVHRYGGLYVKNAVELFGVKNRQGDGSHGIRQ